MNCILLILLFIICIISIIVYRFYINIKDMLNGAFLNKNYCNKQRCDIDNNLYPFQFKETIKKEWDSDVAIFCAQTIYLIEKAVLENKSIIYPETFKKCKIINITTPDLFGIILIYQHQIYIFYRGTQTKQEFKTDFNLQQSLSLFSTTSSSQTKSTFLSNVKDLTLNPSVHRGFNDFYMIFRKQIIDTIKLYATTDTQIIISGHSLGAAIALLTSIDLISNFNYSNIIMYNFASPKVGDVIFADFVNKLVTDNKLIFYRIVNEDDIVPTFPFSVTPNIKNYNKPFIYAHCGVVKTFSATWLSILNNHLLPIYITYLPTIE